MKMMIRTIKLPCFIANIQELEIEFCVVYQHVVLVMTFGVKYDLTLFYACKSTAQIWAVNMMIAEGWLIFLMGLCSDVWINILTLLPANVNIQEAQFTPEPY